MGESITEAVLVRWIKANGDQVETDEPLCEMETDKANFDFPSPAAGVLHTMKQEGETVHVGETIARIDDSADAPPPKEEKKQAARPAEKASSAEKQEQSRAPREKRTEQAAQREEPIEAENAKNEPVKADAAKEQPVVETHRAETEAKPAAEHPEEEPPAAPTEKPVKPANPTERPAAVESEGVRRVPMSKIRRRIAERLVAAQQQAAMLTTFNEIDMTAVLELRNRYNARFEEAHGVPLGLMSFFARACVLALKEFQMLNAEIDGTDILYHDHVNLGIAVSTDRGLVVPVLHGVETMSFGRIEAEIKRMATAARDGKLSLQELGGGTFTITNGGVFGSLLSTPILNPPQSGILGMHAIQKRPVAVDDRIEIRPMIYVALTYDHRLVDGKDSVRFLVRLKELIEDPARMVLGI
jgi:2-oxoglutarate dehydrogenase E2 component (dihydrolipoamide succinyltransferase)